MSNDSSDQHEILIPPDTSSSDSVSDSSFSSTSSSSDAAAPPRKKLTERQPPVNTAAPLPRPPTQQRSHSTGSEEQKTRQPVQPHSTHLSHGHHPPPIRTTGPSGAPHPPNTPSNTLITAAAGASSPTTARQHAARSLKEEESTLEDFLHVDSMTGYRFSYIRSFVFFVLSLASAGVLALLAHWFPTPFMPWRYTRCEMKDADYVYVLGTLHGGQLVPVLPTAAETEEEARQRHLNEVYQQQQAAESQQTNSHAASHADSQHSINGNSGHRAEQPAAKQHKDLSQPLLSSSPSSGGGGPPRQSAGRMIVWRHNRFMWDRSTGSFERVRFASQAASAILDQRLQGGLSAAAASERLVWYGHNILTIIVPSYLNLLVGEVFTPFMVFQLYSVILWCFELYYIFASAIFVIAAVSIITTLLETRKRLISLSTLAYYTSAVQTLRSSVWSLISSADLVVGDIVEVTTGIVPCDISLLDGGCVVNESMLTGESIPVVKGNLQWPINRQSDTALSIGHDQRSTLFSATKVLQLKPSQPGGKVLGIVVRTGFATTKGSLILSILYPKPSTFKFVEQSYRFIGTLFCVALVGFALTIWQLQARGSSALRIFIRACDLVTIVVPPTLPLALSVGTNFALVVLKKMSIFCISPSRINMAGKVRLMAFDKTGTLTSEGLEFIGVLGAQDGHFTTYQTEVDAVEGEALTTPTSGRHQQTTPRKSPTAQPLGQGETKEVEWEEDDEKEGGETSPTSDGSSLAPQARYSYDPAQPHPISRQLLLAMSSCHTLANLDGQLIGDPLDVQVFQTTLATLQDQGELHGYNSLIHLSAGKGLGGASTTLGVREQFDFVAALQRMSVVVEDVQSKAGVCYVKGSPEAISSLCVQSSIPHNFASVLSGYTHQGYRVIAFAYKQLQEPLPHVDKSEQRLLVEKELTFMGLLLLENAVKPETKPTLTTLRHARIRTLMVTGDNPLTAVAVAKECGLVSPGTAVYQSQLVKSLRGEELEWRDTDNPSNTLDPLTLRPTSAVKAPRWELAVTGPAFAHLQAMPSSSARGSLFHRVLLAGQIFARMLPDQKAALIGELQAMGIYCGFCGDGANDCVDPLSPLLLSDGRTTKLARDVVVGDCLYGTGGGAVVVRTAPFTRSEAAMYRITAASGATLVVSPGHLVTLAWCRRTSMYIQEASGANTALHYRQVVISWWRSDSLCHEGQRFRFLTPGDVDPAKRPGYNKYVVYASYEEALAALRAWETANCQGDAYVSTRKQEDQGRIIASTWQREPEERLLVTSFSWVIPGRAWTPEPMVVQSDQEAKARVWSWYHSVFGVEAELVSDSSATAPVRHIDALNADEAVVDDTEDADVLDEPDTPTSQPDTPPAPSTPTASPAPSSPGTPTRRLSETPSPKQAPSPKAQAELPSTMPGLYAHWSLQPAEARVWHPLQHGDLIEVRAEDLAKPAIFELLTDTGAHGRAHPRVAIVQYPSLPAPQSPAAAPPSAVAPRQLMQLMTASNTFRPLQVADAAQLGLLLQNPLTAASLQNARGQEAQTIGNLRTALSHLGLSSITAADGVFITELNPIASAKGEMDSTLDVYTPLCKATMRLALATGAKALVAFGESARLRWRELAPDLPGVHSCTTSFSDADRVWSTWLDMDTGERVRIVYSPHACLTHKLLQVTLAIRAARVHLGYPHPALTEDELAGLEDMACRAALSDLQSIVLAPEVKMCIGWQVDGDGRFVLGNGVLTHNCGALKAAMVGVSLSESEASIAAPFTYQKPNIECIPALLSEGRSSLVTSFQLFRYISMYSLTQFGAAILTYFVGSVLGNWQYLYQDLVIVFPLTVFMGATAANRSLSIKRPSAQLTSATNIFGLAGHTCITLSFQLFVFFYTQRQQGYYLPANPDNTPDAYETTALYYYSNFQYLIIAALFALGRPWKATPLSNYKLTGWWLLMLLISLVFLLVNQRWGFWRSDDLDLWESWRREMLLIVAINALASVMWELMWYPAIVQLVKEVMRRGSGGKEGSWFGRRKVVRGQHVKEYYELRGAYEAYWESGKGDTRVMTQAAR